MRERTWQETPTARLTVGTIGTGTLSITSGRTLYFNAQSNGHTRPEVGLTVRGVRYLVSAHFDLVERGDEIFWDYHGETEAQRQAYLYISRAGAPDVVSAPARRTIAAMLLDAVRAWGQDAASQKLLLAGHAAHLSNALLQKEAALADAQAKTDRLQAEVAQLRLELARLGTP